MKTVIVLAMHGAPPTDFPKPELMELFGLHARLEHITGPERAALERRHAELEARVRAWPRTAQNDPFYAGSQELAEHLSQATGYPDPALVAFNEFCAPSLDEAFEQAIAQSAQQIIVVTPMMTRGGEHSESDIPAAVQRAQSQYLDIPILYAWPFDASEVAKFLASQIGRFVSAPV